MSATLIRELHKRWVEMHQRYTALDSQGKADDNSNAQYVQTLIKYNVMTESGGLGRRFRLLMLVACGAGGLEQKGHFIRSLLLIAYEKAGKVAPPANSTRSGRSSVRGSYGALGQINANIDNLFRQKIPRAASSETFDDIIDAWLRHANGLPNYGHSDAEDWTSTSGTRWWRSGPQKMTDDDLRREIKERRFDGSNAVLYFRRWLETGATETSDFSLLRNAPMSRPPDPEPGTPLQEVLDKVMDFVEGRTKIDCGNGSTLDARVLCVHGAGRQRELTALAGWLDREVSPKIDEKFDCSESPPSILYLPLRRLEPGREAMQYSRLVKHLSLFYEGKQATDYRSERARPDGEPFGSRDELYHAIEQVRLCQSRRESVIILDGVNQEAFVSNVIQHFVSDDGAHAALNDFLLAADDLSATANPHFVDPLSKTRFLLLSEEPLCSRTRFGNPVPLVKALIAGSVALPSRSVDQLRTVLEEAVPKHKGEKEEAHSARIEVLHATLESAFRERGVDTLPEQLNQNALAVISCAMKDSEPLPSDLIEPLTWTEAVAARVLRENGTTALEAIVEAALNRIAAPAPEGERDKANLEDLIVLAASALTFDDVRVPTLRRFIEQSGYSNPQCVGLPAIKDEAEWRDALIERWPGVLTYGADERVIGLDDPLPLIGNPTERLMDQPDALSIASPVLTRVIRRVLTRRFPRLVSLMHHLIGVEALKQHSSLASGSGWDDALRPSFFRRLAEGLFHGYAWILSPDLPAPSRDEDVSCDAGFQPLTDEQAVKLRVAIPAAKREANRSLYSIFFRHLFLGPEREMSRRMGMEALVRDLAVLALHAQVKVSPELEGPTSESLDLYGPLEERLPSFGTPKRITLKAQLRDPAKREEAMALSVIKDQLHTLFYTSYHSNALQTAGRVLPNLRRIPGAHLRDVLKMEADLTNKTDEAQWVHDARSDDRIVSINFTSSETAPDNIRRKALVSGVVDTLWKAVENDSPSAADLRNAMRELVDPAVDQYRNDAAKALAKKIDDSRSDRSALPDVSVAALLCEVSDLVSRLGEFEDAKVRPSRRNHGGQLKAEEDARTLLGAFAHFYLAGRFRRRAYLEEPIHDRYLVNGHPARVSIRCALRLASRIHEMTKSKPPNPVVELLLERARSDIDVLRRHYARLPSERPSILLLEGFYSGVVNTIDPTVLATPEDKKYPLDVECEYVQRSISLSALAPSRARVLMRTLLQAARTNVLVVERELSKESGSPDLKLCENALNASETATHVFLRCMGDSKKIWDFDAEDYLEIIRSLREKSLQDR